MRSSVQFKLDCAETSLEGFQKRQAAIDQILEEALRFMRLSYRLKNADEAHAVLEIGISFLDIGNTMGSDGLSFMHEMGMSDKVLATAELLCVVNDEHLRGILIGTLDRAFRHWCPKVYPGVNDLEAVFKSVKRNFQI